MAAAVAASTSSDAPSSSSSQSACHGCKQNLEETNDSVVVAFGEKLWHVTCFRCAKCRNPVEHDSNLLLLSDGSPVCAKCSYVCSFCSKLIQHEAIVTGDESYHADCFRCKSCRKRIEELVFAKTSTGLWCLECHHARLARSRRHSEQKRNRTIKQGEAAKSSASSSSKEPDLKGLVGLPSTPLVPVTSPIQAEAVGPSRTPASSSSYATARSAPPSPLPPSPQLPAAVSERVIGDKTPTSRSPTLTTNNDATAAPLPTRPTISTRPSTSDGVMTPPLESSATVNGLMAPQTTKQSHRRSGFYGVPASTAPDSDWQVVPPSPVDEPETLEVPVNFADVPTDAIADDRNDMPTSISYYDADMLAKMQDSPPPVPKDGPFEEEHEQPEMLAVSEADEALDSVPARLRESIRQSRSMPAVSSAGAVDVDAVEMLLAELVGTKERMKELQSKYNEAKRASVQVFEGMNQAREEIEQEVAARREAEAEMSRLKEQLRDQASRLGQLDVIQQRAELLQRRSTELSSTVVGIERQLASLKAEREISVAEVQQLKRFSSSEAESPEPQDIIASLDAKLAEIKAQHRAELDSLLAEKEALAREMEEMRQTRDLFAGEAAALNVTNQELSQQNAALRRQMDEAKVALLKMQQQNLSLTTNGHHKSTSSLSRPSISTNGRSSPLSATEISPEQASLASVKRVEPASSPAPRKFKWGKTKVEPLRTMGSSNNLAASLAGSSKPIRNASMQNNRVDAPLPAPGHMMQQISILRPVRCEVCNEKMWGLQERCAHCPLVCHSRCSEQLSGPCPGPSTEPPPTPRGPLLGRALTGRCMAESTSIPRIVVACLEAVEARGMDYEGIYRKSGGTGQVRLIESLFEADKPCDLNDDERFNDISAVTSALKNYFRNLPDSLFTAALHESFMAAGAMRNNDEVQLSKIGECISMLPPAHLSTLSRLMLHLHQVTQQSEENKMTPANLGVVFGPTLLRAGTADDLDGMKDLQHRNRVVEICVTNATRLFG